MQRYSPLPFDNVLFLDVLNYNVLTGCIDCSDPDANVESEDIMARTVHLAPKITPGTVLARVPYGPDQRVHLGSSMHGITS